MLIVFHTNNVFHELAGAPGFSVLVPPGEPLEVDDAAAAVLVELELAVAAADWTAPPAGDSFDDLPTAPELEPEPPRVDELPAPAPEG